MTRHVDQRIPQSADNVYAVTRGTFVVPKQHRPLCSPNAMQGPVFIPPPAADDTTDSGHEHAPQPGETGGTS